MRVLSGQARNLYSITALIAVFGLLVSTWSPVAEAQQTTASVSGQVLDATGNPVAGAKVSVVHTESGTRATTSSGADGGFELSGLRVGGPFTIEATKDGLPTATETDVYTSLDDSYFVQLTMGQAVTEVVVSASRVGEVALGVGTKFSARDIESMASISRDLRDAVRTDPKIVLDPTVTGDALEIAGNNSRYNSITVDGIRQSDDFGLNNNGFPTQRSPISLEAVEAISVQTAPFDVEYSGFQGGTLNVVTKSGTNTFSGSAFYYTFKDSLVGDRSKDRTLNFNIDEQTYGATFGGPIIKDKLFFFVSYEKLKSTSPVEFGPAGSGLPIEVIAISVADYNRVVQFAQSAYNFDAGSALTQSELAELDEKYLVKLDWNIAEGHRASLSYQKSDGNGIVTSNNSTATRFLSTTSQWYDRAFPLEQIALQLNSQWNDNFSTAFEFGRKEVTGKQDSLRGTDFGEMRVCNFAPVLPATAPNNFRTCAEGTVFVGADEFRHANSLTNDLDQFKISAEYRLGNHTLKAGVELEKLEIFNEFVPRSEGQWFFNTIDQFGARQASRFIYENAFTNNSADGSATFGFDTWSFYLQDTWKVNQDLTLQLGARIDTYKSSDAPPLNSNFVTRQGFANNLTIDGKELFSPRFGFNWQALPALTVRGGVGIFGGGSPNVWISNSFSNDGVTIVRQQIDRPANNALTPLQAAALNNVNGLNIPQAVLDAHGLLRGNGSVNALSPDFEIPSSTKANIGLDYTFDIPKLGDNFTLSFDAIFTNTRDAVLWKDLRLTRTGSAPDGRPIYTSPGTNDLVLTTTDQGESTILTLGLDKTWKNRAGRFDLYVGYGYQDVKDVNSGTSSTALSNWDNLAVADVNNPALATSNYEIEHRFPISFNWRKPFFGDNNTSVGLFIERRSGRPFSYTFGAGTTLFGDPRQGARQRQLFYVPRDDSDVSVTGALTLQALNDFLRTSGLDRYRGQIAPRNAFRSPWITVADLKISQEIPGFFKEAKGIVELNIENFGNLLNKDWGRIEQVGLPYVSPVVDAAVVNGRYQYRVIGTATGPRSAQQNLSALPSVYRIQLGFKYVF